MMSVSIWKNTAVFAYRSKSRLKPINPFSWQSPHIKKFDISPAHLLHGDVNGAEPSAVHPEEADQVGPVVHHRDVHLEMI